MGVGAYLESLLPGPLNVRGCQQSTTVQQDEQAEIDGEPRTPLLLIDQFSQQPKGLLLGRPEDPGRHDDFHLGREYRRREDMPRVEAVSMALMGRHPKGLAAADEIGSALHPRRTPQAENRPKKVPFLLVLVGHEHGETLRGGKGGRASQKNIPRRSVSAGRPSYMSCATAYAPCPRKSRWHPANCCQQPSPSCGQSLSCRRLRTAHTHTFLPRR